MTKNTSSDGIKKVLIVAPHIDDEVIGCYSVLCDLNNHVSVLYLFELNAERRQEALAAARMFKFIPYFGDGSLMPVSQALGLRTGRFDFDEVYVPSRKDWHADHQIVNRAYRSIATHFYSVDMNQGELLEYRDAKRQALDYCYPSQSGVWTLNEKYWLFEDIQTTDYDVYARIDFKSSGDACTVIVLDEYKEWVGNTWLPTVYYLGAANIGRTEIDTLLAHCSGKVVIETPHGRMEAT